MSQSRLGRVCQTSLGDGLKGQSRLLETHQQKSHLVEVPPLPVLRRHRGPCSVSRVLKVLCERGLRRQELVENE